MGLCFSKDSSKDTPEAKKSKQVDRLIKDDEKRMTKEVKLLLLGENLRTHLCCDY